MTDTLKPKQKLKMNIHFRCSRKDYAILKKHSSRKKNITVSDVIRHSINLLSREQK
jgi:hypothetical protein